MGNEKPREYELFQLYCYETMETYYRRAKSEQEAIENLAVELEQPVDSIEVWH